HAHVPQNVAERVDVRLHDILLIAAAAILQGDGRLSSLEECESSSASPGSALPDELIPGSQAQRRRQVLIAALDDHQRSNLAESTASVKVNHGVRCRHQLIDI